MPVQPADNHISTQHSVRRCRGASVSAGCAGRPRDVRRRTTCRTSRTAWSHRLWHRRGNQQVRGRSLPSADQSGLRSDRRRCRSRFDRYAVPARFRVRAPGVAVRFGRPARSRRRSRRPHRRGPRRDGLDSAAADAVLHAAGQPRDDSPWRLTPRGVEILVAAARGGPSGRSRALWRLRRRQSAPICTGSTPRSVSTRAGASLYASSTASCRHPRGEHRADGPPHIGSARDRGDKPGSLRRGARVGSPQQRPQVSGR
jgi:hypothetical protein